MVAWNCGRAPSKGRRRSHACSRRRGAAGRLAAFIWARGDSARPGSFAKDARESRPRCRRTSPKEIKRLLSETFAVLLVCTNPLPEKGIARELTYGAVVITHAHRPVRSANRFKAQRRMEGIGRPKP